MSEIERQLAEIRAAADGQRQTLLAESERRLLAAIAALRQDYDALDSVIRDRQRRPSAQPLGHRPRPFSG